MKKATNSETLKPLLRCSLAWEDQSLAEIFFQVCEESLGGDAEDIRTTQISLDNNFGCESIPGSPIRTAQQLSELAKSRCTCTLILTKLLELLQCQFTLYDIARGFSLVFLIFKIAEIIRQHS